MADRVGDRWPDIEPLPDLRPPPPVPVPRPAPPSSLPPATLAPTPPWPPQPPLGSPYPPSGQESNYLPWIITAALAIFVALLVAVGVSATSDDSDETGDRPTPTTAEDADADADADDEPEAVEHEADPTTTEAPTPAASTEPPPPEPGFGDGTLLVGQDIQPGLYMSTGEFGCYWERRSAVDNGFDGLIANGFGGPAVVEILASDTAFLSESCGRWVDYAPPPEPAASFGDGDWVVGEQILPGTYRVESPFEMCMWERARGFTHDFDENIDYGFEVSAGDTVRLSAGERFTTSLCGTWTLT